MIPQILSSITMAFQSLASNKMRALLTMLGIIIGVGSVITLTAIGEGARVAIANRIGSMGTNMLQIDPGPTNFGGVSSGAGGSVKLVEADAEVLKQSPFLADVAPSVDTRAQVVAANANWPTRIVGTTPNCLAIRNFSLAAGSLFSDMDAKVGKKVCILGQTVVDNLFPSGTDPVGQTVRIRQVPFIVVGILTAKGTNAYGQDQDDVVFAPLATIENRIMGVTWLDDIYVSTTSIDVTQFAIQDVTTMLRQQHRIAPGVQDNFRIRSQVEIAQAAQKSNETMSSLLTMSAIIALLVGGIGIMNIMLVSVTERTREIGIRKSIGAKPMNILAQFLTEAMALSLAGGIIGVLGGYFASLIVAKQNGWSLLISTQGVILSFTAATLVGLFFGWYPARKASKMNPIEALRYD